MNHWAFCSVSGLPLLLLPLLLLLIEGRGKGDRAGSGARVALMALCGAPSLVLTSSDADADAEGRIAPPALCCPSVPVPNTCAVPGSAPARGVKGPLRSEVGGLGVGRVGNMAGPGMKRDEVEDVDGVCVNENCSGGGTLKQKGGGFEEGGGPKQSGSGAGGVEGMEGGPEKQKGGGRGDDGEESLEGGRGGGNLNGCGEAEKSKRGGVEEDSLRGGGNDRWGRTVAIL